MKKIQNILIGLVAVMLLSCGGVLQSEKIVEVSEDGRLTLEVEGKRDGKLEPFLVKIVAKKEGFEPMLATMEIHHENITRENVKFDWKSNNHCIISIAHRDGKEEIAPVRFVGVE